MADGAHWTQIYHSATSAADDSTLITDGQPATKPARKRPRASRRAPTTLLNTNTSNFRSMVQQFTGVPSAPYISGGSSAINFGLGFGFDNPIQRTAAVLPSFGLQQQPFNNFSPLQQQEEIMGFAMNYENIEDEFLHVLNSTWTAGPLPELLDGIAGGMPPAMEYGRSDGYSRGYN